MVDDVSRQRQRAGIGSFGAGQDLEQGRLAGTVLADQRMHLSSAHVERHAAQRMDARK
jgi:hypothetical protein